ncbi:MAG: hypothetical protein Kow0099_14970 [Candidatus Abyssubacteria bacterium]
MKRILFASHSASLTGAPQVLFNIVSHLDRSRFEPLALFPAHGPMVGKCEAASVPTAVISIGDSRWDRSHIPMIEALCAAKRISLIHANTVHGYPFVFAAQRLGIPCFWYIHEMLSLGAGTAVIADEKEFLPAMAQASLVGTVSRACGEDLNGFCGLHGVSAPEIAVVHNGVRVPETYTPYKPRENVKLMSVGNLMPHKGYHFLIDALAMLNASGHSASLTVLGDGDPDYSNRLSARARNARADNQVRFLTSVPDVAPYLECADIMVNPSVVENFSLAIAEAMAYAKPVVATDVGGTRELITHGETGLLVPPRDPEALADAIRTFIEKPDFARECGERARAHVAGNFGIRAQVERLQEIYDSLLLHAEGASAAASVADAGPIYDLIFDSLVSVNETLRRIEDRMERTDRYFIGYLNNIERDVRTVERVLDNLFQKPPVRLYRAIAAFTKRVGRAIARIVSRTPENQREE